MIDVLVQVVAVVVEFIFHALTITWHILRAAYRGVRGLMRSEENAEPLLDSTEQRTPSVDTPPDERRD